MRLLLIEDDAAIARELRLRWAGRGWLAHACSTLASADAALAGPFDVILLDLGLPDGDGLAWLVELRRRDRITPVLVLTARDGVADRVRGLQGGADDYLVKPFAAEELDARIEVLMRRARAQRGDAIVFGALTWLRDEGVAHGEAGVLDLSPREFEVLGLLVTRAPRLLPKRALIDALAERNLEVGDSAAEVYVSRLRRKLVGSGVAIRTLKGFGYLLELDSGAAGSTAGSTAGNTGEPAAA